MRCYLEIPPDAVDATRDFWRAHKGEARVLPRDQDGDGRIASIEARAPLAELDRYGDELMRITQGCAQPLLYFDGFQPVRAA
jgi:translation elongation factor EF-G